MARFKEGQEVVCIDMSGVTGGPFPKEGEIVTVSGYSKTYPNNVILKEYNGPNLFNGKYYKYCSFKEHRFEPLMDITEILEQLEQQPAEA